MGRIDKQRGQSIIEYLVIAATVILAVVLLKQGFGSSIESLGSSAGSQVGTASGKLSGVTGETPSP